MWEAALEPPAPWVGSFAQEFSKKTFMKTGGEPSSLVGYDDFGLPRIWQGRCAPTLYRESSCRRTGFFRRKIPSKVQRAFDARRENSSGGNHFEQAMSECDFTELVLACLCAEFIRVGIVEAGSLSWRMAAHCS